MRLPSFWLFRLPPLAVTFFVWQPSACTPPAQHMIVAYVMAMTLALWPVFQLISELTRAH